MRLKHSTSRKEQCIPEQIPDFPVNLKKLTSTFEKAMIIAALNRSETIAEAARKLTTNRTTLVMKMKAHKILTYTQLYVESVIAARK